MKDEDDISHHYSQQDEISDGGNFGALAQKEKSKNDQMSKFQNAELQQKTEELQAEFEKVMGELINQRNVKETEHFYQAINEFYNEEEGHESPTKRLID